MVKSSYTGGSLGSPSAWKVSATSPAPWWRSEVVEFGRCLNKPDAPVSCSRNPLLGLPPPARAGALGFDGELASIGRWRKAMFAAVWKLLSGKVSSSLFGRHGADESTTKGEDLLLLRWSLISTWEFLMPQKEDHYRRPVIAIRLKMQMSSRYADRRRGAIEASTSIGGPIQDQWRQRTSPRR